MSYNPFSDLKVLDLSTVLAGPSVGMFLAELGAEVIKIEHPNHKDVTRTWKNETEKSDFISSYFSSINYKKKYISLDLGIESNREEFLSLVKNSDLLISNFKRADYIKFNITKNILFELNPSLIHGRITGYGTDSDRVAYDLILQAETGFMSMNGTPESGPVKMPVALIDVLAAHHLKEGVLIALYERLKTGEGREVSVSLYQAAVSSLVNQASSYLMNNTIPKRIGSLHPSIAPYGEIFITKDDRYLTFAIGNNQQFEKLMNFLKLEELAKDERFVTNQSRVIFRSLLFEKMNKTIQSIESKTIELFCLENNIPCGLIKSMDEVFQQPLSQELIREENIDNQQTKRVSSIAFKIG